MSIEGLLLFVFFVVLPLVQQWRERQKKAEQRQAPRRPPARTQPAEPVQPFDEAEMVEEDGVPWSGGWERPVEPPAVPPPPPARRPTAAPVPVSARPHVPSPARPQRPARPVRAMRQVRPDAPIQVIRAARVHRRQSEGAALGLSGRADLRNAIVQMTILGPCRAQQPYSGE